MTTTASAYSQDPGEDAFHDELPVVLTATRLVQPQRDVPVATTIIDREMIAASGFTEIVDLLRYVPGFIVNYDSGHIKAASYQMLNERYARRMQVMIDGRSIYSPSYLGVPWTSLPITIDDIERIEVIRGPNAASFGSNSLLGVVSIITRHASQEHGVMLKANTGGNLHEGFARIGENIGDMDLKATLGYQQDDGFEERYDSRQTEIVNFRADYQATANQSITFLTGYNNSPRQEDNVFDSDIPHHMTHTTSRFQQVIWTHNFSTTEYVKAQFYQLTEDLRKSFVHISTSLDIDQGHRSERSDFELEHSLQPTEDLQLVWGVSQRIDRMNSTYYLGSNPERSNRIKRVFTNLAWYILPDTIINGGLMLEDNGISGSELSPRISVNHHLTSTDTVRVSYSKASRIQGMLEEYTDITFGGAPYVIDAGDILPETIRAYEIGYIGYFPQYRSNLDLKIYHSNIRNLITLEPVDADGNLPYHFDNVDDARITGFEMTFSTRPIKSLRAELSYAHSKIRATDIYNTTKYSNSAPDNNLSLLLMYYFPQNYFASTSVFYQSQMKELATEDLRNSKTRINMKLGKTFKGSNNNTEVALVVKNITNDFENTRLENVYDRQTYLSIKTEFN
ncbi:MAG: TonB-dependent receptor [Gammaproteobacteria bacterium]|nr:TonB-dependent receptor [Gammaproteobacteria bacterium]